ncbi:MAG: class D sortase [Actinobacteria bacterium]|nr:class D sortase [Actinomycetota bacterium]
MTDVRVPTRAPSRAPAGDDAARSEPVEPGASTRLGPFRVPSSDDALRIAGYGLTIFGLVVVAYAIYLFGVSRLEYGRSQRSLMTALSTQLAEGRAPLGGSIADGAPVAVLQIPRIHLRVAVVEGTSGSVLRQGPGHLRTSPLPGQRGSSVVMGRRLGFGGPFRNLGNLRKGDEIRTITGEGRATYVVTSVRTANRDGTNVLGKSPGNRLALVTSTPELRAERRLVVTADLRTVPVLTPIGRPTEVNSNELGLQGDGSTVLPLMLWAELLLVTAVGAAWLYRRWSFWSTYLVTTPVLVLLLLLVFDNLTPILPSTL